MIFLWNGKITKRNENTMCSYWDSGGFGLTHLHSWSKANKLTGIKRFFVSKGQWKLIPFHYLRNVGGKLLFCCNYDKKCIPEDLPPFYKDIFQLWAEIRQKDQQNKNEDIEVLWNNTNICIEGAPVYFHDFFSHGFVYIRDLFTEENIPIISTNKDTLRQVNFTDNMILRLMGLTNAIPHELKNHSLKRLVPNRPLRPFLFYGDKCFDCLKIRAKQYYDVILNYTLKLSQSRKTFCNKFNLTDAEWKKYCLITNNVTIESSIRC